QSPTDGQCIDNPSPKVEGNLHTEVGQPATLTYRIEKNPIWVIWLPEGEETFTGETISVTINQTGRYQGVVWGFNNCDERIEKIFEIVVVPALGVPSIAIDNDAVLTRSNNVTLSLHAENATEMYVTNDATCSS